MQKTTGGPGRGRYLVSSANPAVLADFIARAGEDPALQLLQTIGPPGAPHTAVYDMPHEAAAMFTQRFGAGGSLRIEPDRPLSPFGC